jgi:hypothetical protein
VKFVLRFAFAFTSCFVALRLHHALLSLSLDSIELIDPDSISLFPAKLRRDFSTSWFNFIVVASLLHSNAPSSSFVVHNLIELIANRPHRHFKS